jgi:hypothetical protein
MSRAAKVGTMLATGAAALAVAGVGSAVTPKKTVAFSATYAGTATVQVTDQVADISASGKGTGTLIGSSSITGKGTGDASQQPCAPFTGPGTMVGSGGKLAFTVVSGSQGCGDEQGQVFSISGKANVTSATGKLKKAKGQLKFTGVYDRGQGTFSVKFKGTLTI